MKPLTFQKFTLQETAPKEFGAKATRFRSAIHCIKFSRDGNYATLGTSTKLLCLYNPYRGRLLQTYMGHGLDITGCDSNDDNSCLLSSSKDFSCMYWDVETGKTLKRFRDHLGAVTCCQFPFDTSSLALTGSIDTNVRVFDCESRNQNKPVQEMDHATDSITAIDSKRHYIVSGSADGFVRVYDIRKGKLANYDLDSGIISGLKLSRDCQSCLVNLQAEGRSNETVLLDLLSPEKNIGENGPKILQKINNIENYENSMYSINCCFNGKKEDKIITGSDKGYLFRFDLVNGSQSKYNSIKLSDNPVLSVSHHPKIDGRMICCSAEGYYLVREEDDVDEHIEKDADLRVEGQTTNKKRCLEREYLPGAFLGSRDSIYSKF